MSEKSELKICIPEDIGIPSDAILKFIENLEQRKVCLHSFMILRREKIAAEGYYPPFKSDTLHQIYSISKSFVALAIGLLIDEGKLTLNQRAAEFFPEYQPKNLHPYIAQTTIRDLLIMTSPFDSCACGKDDKNWVWSFLNHTPSHKSGAIFIYDTAATTMLCAIAEKLSGLSLLDYMRPKLLDQIGFSKEAWCIERPEGGSWGGAGVMCNTHDLAILALLLLNKRRWDGKQLISKDYIEQATSALVDTKVTPENPELQFGYGYQIWRTRNNGFACVGMGCQLAVCLPDKELILISTADTQIIGNGSDIILDAFWKDIYQHITESPDKKLPVNDAAYKNLQNKLTNLEFLPVDGKPVSSKSHLFNGNKYVLDKNKMNISDVQFIFDKSDSGIMRYTNLTGNHEIQFGIGKYKDEMHEFPETHYFGKQIGVPKGSGYKYKASGAWFDDDTLIIYLYIIDTHCGTLRINASFCDDGRQITLFMNKAALWCLDEYEGIASGTKG